MTLSEREFHRVDHLVLHETGLSIDKNQYSTIKRFMDHRLNERQISSNHYVNELHELNSLEFNRLLTFILNHETFFFRDFGQLSYFAEQCLPKIQHRKIQIQSQMIRGWSAGCSTGEEAYTLAIILDDMLDYSLSHWQIDIIATDITMDVLDLAKKGVYHQSISRSIPQVYLDTYFTLNNHSYSLKPSIKDRVFFHLLNLANSNQIKKYKGFDFIFCKNVLFYFEPYIQKRIIHSFYHALHSGGFLFVDYSTTIQQITKKLPWIACGKYFYQK